MAFVKIRKIITTIVGGGSLRSPNNSPLDYNIKWSLFIGFTTLATLLISKLFSFKINCNSSPNINMIIHAKTFKDELIS